MITRLAKPPETSGGSYKLMENVSEWELFFSNIPQYNYLPLRIVFMTGREIQYKKEYKKQLN